MAPVATMIDLGGMPVEVVKKDIKNIHLSVHPPSGRVRISAPLRMKLDTIRIFAISKLGWIKLQQKKLREQERETPREYLDRESHFVWGKRYLLELVETEGPTQVALRHNKLRLRIRAGASAESKQTLLEEWYRDQLKQALPPLISKWERLIGVRVDRFFVQRMKTKWGSCNPVSKTIRLNTELAKKPAACLEYLVVHEMIHLLEPTHNRQFIALIDRFMPKWQFYRETLNRLPVRHESWKY